MRTQISFAISRSEKCNCILLINCFLYIMASWQKDIPKWLQVKKLSLFTKPRIHAEEIFMVDFEAVEGTKSMTHPLKKHF